MGKTAPRNINAKNNVMTVQTMLDNKRKRNEFTFVCKPNGERFFRKGDVVFAIQEIEKAYPVPYSMLVRRNTDKTKSWMN